MIFVQMDIKTVAGDFSLSYSEPFYLGLWTIELEDGAENDTESNQLFVK